VTRGETSHARRYEIRVHLLKLKYFDILSQHIIHTRTYGCSYSKAKEHFNKFTYICDLTIEKLFLRSITRCNDPLSTNTDVDDFCSTVNTIDIARLS
jgi:hypothetical protein